MVHTIFKGLDSLIKKKYLVARMSDLYADTSTYPVAF